MTTVIAYDANIPYDSDIWYYDGGAVRWSAAIDEGSPGAELTEGLVGSASLDEKLLARAAVSDE